MLGRGLESLIPPREPEEKPMGNPEREGGDKGSEDRDELRLEQIPERSPETESVSENTSEEEEKVHAVIHSEQSTDRQHQRSSPSRSSQPEKLGESVFQIETNKIVPNPHQPRRNFDEEGLRELAASIREFGILQPLVVTKVEKEVETGTLVEYQLIAGERRLLAARIAGLQRVPVIVRSVSLDREKLELALIENVQRDDLNPIEAARAFARLQDDFRLTQREIAAKVGKSREFIANALRLLNLPSDIQDAVAEGRVTESQARLLLGVSNIADQQMLFQSIVRDNLSVREVKARIQRITPSRAQSKQKPSVDPEVASLKQRLEEFLGTKVDLRQEGQSGKILINFYSIEELQGIIDKLLIKDS